MSSNRQPSFLRSVTFRLTLMYTAIFAVSSLVLLAVIYVLLETSLRNQADAMLVAEIQEVSTQWKDEGAAEVQEDFGSEAEAGPGDEVYSRIVFADGRPTFSTNPGFWSRLAPSTEIFERFTDSGVHYNRQTPEGQTAPVRLCSMQLGPGVVLQVGRSMHGDLRMLARYRRIASGMLIIVFVPASLVGWFLSRRAMAGVVRVAETARRIEQGDLSQRVERSGRGDEIDWLAGSFNTMVERLQVLLAEWKEISNNIAHDLRSPITRIRGLSEAAAANSNDPSAVEWAGSVVEESDRLIGIINTMLEIAETESGTRSQMLAPVDMEQLVSDACDLFRPMAEDKGLELAFEAAGPPAVIQGETGRLQRVVANLIDNAIKYTSAGGRVHLTLRIRDDQLELEIADTGMGLSDEDGQRIFDRFYRADPSRSTPGNGLGLSLAQAIAQSYGGTISVTSAIGQGSSFTLRLPTLSDAETS